MQFKIYQDGDGTTAGDTGGTLKWTESYVNNNASAGIQVKNGFFSVELGSNSPLSSVDWNQDTLWLSMNIAGSSASCSTFGGTGCVADGEMLPMKRITSSPYALNSGMLGGKTADKFLQLGQGAQTDVNTSSSIYINKTASGDLIQLQNNSTDIFTVGNAGDLTLGSNADKTISISTAAANTAGNSLTVVAGGGGTGTGSAGGNLVLQGGSAGGTNGDGGDVAIDSGAANGSGTDGVISLGADHASAINLGSSTNNTQVTINGPTSVKQATDSTSAFNVTNSQNNQVLTVNTSTSQVNVGNANTVGSALDVTGGINSSTGYSIGGASVLTDSSLTFTGAGSSSIQGSNGLSLTGGTSSLSITDNGVQVGSGSGAGEPTLLTLDKSSSNPASAAYGSMYYDTGLGKVQCYQSNGWGACGDSPDSFVTLSPEYSNAVMNGAGTGTITSDLCSDSLNINDGSSSQPTVCGTNETYNFYDWTSTQTSAQTRSIYVTYQLPSNFKNFVAGSTSLMARTDGSDATTSYQIYRSHGGSALASCGSEITASTGSQSTWQQSTASDGNDPTNCSFAAGDSILIRINLTSSHSANAYVSNLNFAYSNQ
ncbi:MAG TPA: hypothetical protein VLH14_02345 [Patescibacteria group bacterium]|nr:hypothetical protein [Patescibacteria group bacterium]